MTDCRWTIAIDRDRITAAELADAPAPRLADGQIELRLDLAAMTANNVTYAALGRPSGLFDNGKGYWDFFAPGEGPGVLPVWGFATVVKSMAAGIDPGDDIYGFFPLASHAVLTPARIGPLGFADASPHRLDMAAVYNSYQQVAQLDGYRSEDRDWWPVFRPLYLTGWLIADQFADEQDHGAEQILVASASAKTAIAFAHATRSRAGRPRMIGLTSARGRDFLAPTALYDELLCYDELAALPLAASALVDVAGNVALAAALHGHLGQQLRHHLVVGKSHWDAGVGAHWPATGFFAPGRIQKRMQDWGPAAFRARTGAAWADFLSDAVRLFRRDCRNGADAALTSYREAVAGRLDPQAAVLLRP